MEHEATQARLVAADATLQRLATLANEPWVRPEQVNDVRTYYEARRQRYHGVARGETNSRVALATTAAERLEHALINAELAAWCSCGTTA